MDPRLRRRELERPSVGVLNVHRLRSRLMRPGERHRRPVGVYHRGGHRRPNAHLGGDRLRHRDQWQVVLGAEHEPHRPGGVGRVRERRERQAGGIRRRQPSGRDRRRQAVHAARLGLLRRKGLRQHRSRPGNGRPRCLVVRPPRRCRHIHDRVVVPVLWIEAREGQHAARRQVIASLLERLDEPARIGTSHTQDDHVRAPAEVALLVHRLDLHHSVVQVRRFESGRDVRREQRHHAAFELVLRRLPVQ